MGWNEVFSKITDEILVSAFNFLFSFLVIFKEKKDVSIGRGLLRGKDGLSDRLCCLTQALQL